MKAALITLAAALALLAGATSAGSAAASGHRFLGAVFHRGSAQSQRGLAAAANPSGPLTYHGLTSGPYGSVMRTNTTYAIYWFPSGYANPCGAVDTGCADYEGKINQYFTDVAADSGKTTNVYSTDTQYYDLTGSIAYQSAFGGSYVDTTPFPTSGNCTAATVCLTDAELETEIQNVLTAKGWQASPTNMYFLMTPDGVASCTDNTNTECSTNVFCAYHSAFGSFAAPVIYANQPYDATINGCQSQESPNHDDADSELSTISHEHNEAITDPYSGAWYSDGAGASGEIGDLCAWTFGTPSGAPGAEYNQTINGHHYWLQEEYSNLSAGCVQQFSGTALPANLAPPVVSGTAAFGQALTTSTGTWTGLPTSFGYQWQRCDSTGANCVDIAGATGSSYVLGAADVGERIRSEVSATNTGGASLYSAAVPSNIVVPALTTTVLPVVSGVATVGRTLSTTEGTWNTATSSFAFQWLRCSASGTSCAAIAGATGQTYKIAAADAGHTLEAGVSATNPAGTVEAFSAPTGVVATTPKALHGPAISGQAKVGKTLKASTGSWSGSPTRFQFAWLRCNAHGSACTHIAGATRSSYHLAASDAGHRLRVHVTATGPAGSASATSGATARVKH
jgi:hypothetical protein